MGQQVSGQYIALASTVRDDAEFQGQVGKLSPGLTVEQRTEAVMELASTHAAELYSATPAKAGRVLGFKLGEFNQAWKRVNEAAAAAGSGATSDLLAALAVAGASTPANSSPAPVGDDAAPAEAEVVGGGAPAAAAIGDDPAPAAAPVGDDPAPDAAEVVGGGAPAAAEVVGGDGSAEVVGGGAAGAVGGGGGEPAADATALVIAGLALVIIAGLAWQYRAAKQPIPVPPIRARG